MNWVSHRFFTVFAALMGVVACASAVCAAELPNEDDDTPVDFRREILFQALNERQVYSQQALYRCSLHTRNADIQKLSLDLWNQRNDEFSGQALLDRLALQFRIDQLRPLCKTEIDSYEGKLERKKRKPFLLIEGMIAANPMFSSALPLVLELDPVCATAFAPDQSSGEIEVNTCIAGHSILFSKIISQGIDQALSDSTSFIWEVYNQVNQAKPHSKIDYWQIYRKMGRDNPMQFLSMLASLHTIAASGQGYIDQFEESIVRYQLKQTHSSTSALRVFESFVDRRDRMPQYRNLAQEKQISITIDGEDFTNYNHHDVIAAFLTCHYRETSRSTAGHLLPTALGIAYEAKDFVANMSTGWSLKEALAKFRRNVHRYKRGRDLGEKLCAAR